MERIDTDSKKRIRAAKDWLSKAEQAYAEDSSAKGQLQVMLAKAELRRLEESGAPSLWRRNRKTLVALCCVVIIGVVYVLGPLSKPPAPPASFTETVSTENPTPTATSPATTATMNTSSQSDTATAMPAPKTTASQDASATPTSAPSDSVATTHSADTTLQKSAVNETSIMSDSQIRAAVRDGGRSLRGQ